MLFTKVTFFIMYLNIFGQWRWMRIAATVGGIFTAAFYTAFTATLFAIATPGRHETWVGKQSTGSSGRLRRELAPAQSAVGLGIDLYVLILPIIAVCKLQMPFSRKLGVTVIFMSAILYESPFPPSRGEFDHLDGILNSRSACLVYRVRLLTTDDEMWLATPTFITT